MAIEKKPLKKFEIITQTENGKYIFLTKAKDGKRALKCLIYYSLDFKHILGSKESNNITINIWELKKD